MGFYDTKEDAPRENLHYQQCLQCHDKESYNGAVLRTIDLDGLGANFGVVVVGVITYQYTDSFFYFTKSYEIHTNASDLAYSAMHI